MFWGRILTILTICIIVESIELKGLQLLVNVISGEFMETKAKEDDDTTNTATLATNGISNYTFIEFITYQDQKVCDLYKLDKSLGANRNDGRRPVIKVKCIPERGTGVVQIVSSIKEVVSILAPHGNSTKRSAIGNCALILFYTRSCPGSAAVAPHFNALARQFPDIKIAAIDAFKFHSFNTEFGVVGLPTILLFHQGRPVVKFNDTASTVNHFANFITKHTSIKPASSSAYVTSEDFNGPLPSKVEKERDEYLYLAWAFIIVCSAYYFTKSKLYTQMIEMIKRNWRESEAQHEHNS